MTTNKILLLEDSITIFDIDYYDLETILSWAVEIGCSTQLLEDDGVYSTVKVSGAEKVLYTFMQCVFRRLSGIVR